MSDVQESDSQCSKKSKNGDERNIKVAPVLRRSKSNILESMASSLDEIEAKNDPQIEEQLNKSLVQKKSVPCPP